MSLAAHPSAAIADALRPAHIFPLERFGLEHRQRIMDAVASPTPPPRWLNIEFIQMPSRAWYEWHWHRGVDPFKQREPIPAAIRQRIYDRDGNACLACGSTTDLTLDHLEHFSKGGRDTVDNLRTLCRRCNSSRGTRTDVEWIGSNL